MASRWTDARKLGAVLTVLGALALLSSLFGAAVILVGGALLVLGVAILVAKRKQARGLGAMVAVTGAFLLARKPMAS